jgi:hypothetical protein
VLEHWLSVKTAPQHMGDSLKLKHNGIYLPYPPGKNNLSFIATSYDKKNDIMPRNGQDRQNLPGKGGKTVIGRKVG